MYSSVKIEDNGRSWWLIMKQGDPRPKAKVYTEDDTKTILQALNAWQDIQQVANDAHNYAPQDGAFNVLEAVYKHAKPQS